MGDFVYGQSLKGAGRTHNAIDLKFSLLDPTLKASSLHFFFGFLAEWFLLSDWRAFQKCPTKIHDVSFL